MSEILYSEKNGRVTLDMGRDDADMLTVILGFATGACFKQKQDEQGHQFIAFVNRLYAGNPHYTPYKIPAAAKV